MVVKQFKCSFGFSLIEVLVVLAILSLSLTMGFMGIFRTFNTSSLDNQLNQIYQIILNQQLQAMLGDISNPGQFFFTSDKIYLDFLEFNTQTIVYQAPSGFSISTNGLINQSLLFSSNGQASLASTSAQINLFSSDGQLGELILNEYGVVGINK